MKGKLFDSSALINCVRLGKAAEIIGEYTIELIKFEVGNYVWKRRSNLKYEESRNLLEKLLELINSMNILPIDFTEALSIAVKENITFYDSSYIQAASQNNLELVTDDLKLYNVARKYIKVLRSQDIK